MAHKATNWAWELDLRMTEKFVLIALADMADERFSCFPGQKRIASMVGGSERTVRRALADLEEMGLIEREERRAADGYRTSDRYVLKVGATTTGQIGRQSSEGGSHRPIATISPAIHDSLTGHSDRAIEPLENHQIEPPVILPSDADASDVSGFSDDVLRLSDLLAEMVKANGHKVGTVGVGWWRACERLMRLDGYTAEQIEWLMRWTMRDEFWIANIRSMSKFREKFTTLKAQATANPQGRGVARGKPAAFDRAAEVVRIYQEEERREEVGDGRAVGAGGDRG